MCTDEAVSSPDQFHSKMAFALHGGLLPLWAEKKLFVIVPYEEEESVFPNVLVL